jgi:hypothetical protein
MNDIEPGVDLSALDPGTDDPRYWGRFQSRVMGAAGPELARRRRIAAATMSDVLLSWGRLVVPGAVMAAAAAGLLLMQPPGTDGGAPDLLLGLEELVVQSWGEGEDALPAFLLTDGELDRDAVLFAVESH